MKLILFGIAIILFGIALIIPGEWTVNIGTVISLCGLIVAGIGALSKDSD